MQKINNPKQILEEMAIDYGYEADDYYSACEKMAQAGLRNTFSSGSGFLG